MEEYLKWLNNNQWLNLIFLGLAILSIIISIYLFRKSRKNKKPIFDKRSINVISDKIQKIGDIKVKYKGDKIENLTVTKVAFWNNGNETINESDQAPTDKLRIELNESYRVLDAEVIFQSAPTNNIQIENLANKILVTFDYIDGDEGGIIKFIHTGKKSSDVEFLGTFKGSNKLKQVNSGIFDIGISVILNLPFFGQATDRFRQIEIFQKSFPWIMLLTGIGLGLALFYSNTEKPDRIFIAILGAIYTTIGLILVFGKNGMPKGFKVFYDDE